MGRSEPSPSPWPGSCRRAASSGGAPGGSGSSSPAPPPPAPPGGSGPLLKGLRCACRNRASLSSYAIALRDAAPTPRGTARTGTGTGTGPPGGVDSAEPRPLLAPPLPLAPPGGRRTAQRWVGLRTASGPIDPVRPPASQPIVCAAPRSCSPPHTSRRMGASPVPKKEWGGCISTKGGAGKLS